MRSLNNKKNTAPFTLDQVSVGQWRSLFQMPQNSNAILTPSKSSPPISTSEPFLSLQHPEQANTHTQNHMPDEKMYLKQVHILENVVNICIINDLYYPPVTHPQIIRMHFFITRPTRPADITAIRASLLRRYQPHHWVVGCQVEGTNGLKFACVDCVRRMCFIQDLATRQPWNMLMWLFI